MKRKLWQIVLVTSLTLLFSGMVIAVAKEPWPQDGIGLQVLHRDDSVDRSVTGTAYTPTTVITVTSAGDPDDHSSYTCYSDPYGAPGPPMSPCTLRRALVEATALSEENPANEPILIKFNIPMTDSYNATLQVWTIELYDTTDLYALPRMEGDQIIVDGDTQGEIGGRTDGPKIIIRGPDGSQNGMPIDGDNNIVRGLAFQTLKNYLYLNGDNNLVEDNWFGLADDGKGLHLRNDLFPEDGSGYTGIDFAGGLTGAIGNTVCDNVFAGFTGVAAAIKGRENIFTGNYVGAIADGTVPLQGSFDQHPCQDGVWHGGSGISIADRDHQIGGPDEADRNVFAGLYLELFEISTQPPAVRIGSGQGHLIQNNYIGLDAHGDTIGVCGRGMDMLSGAEAMQVISNTIVEPGLSAIMANHWTFNGNTLQGNIIKRESAWPGKLPGCDSPENAIAFADKVPAALRNFQPAVVTEVSGTLVSGVSGSSLAGQTCDNCTVELFLDDTDTVIEALQSLDVVIADSSGHWTATLPAPLGADERLRTMSTVPDGCTITSLDAGSTSNLSVLYPRYDVFLPLAIRQ